MKKFFPSYKSGRQLTFESLGELWDNVPINKWQHASVITGDFFEEASKQLLSLGGDTIKRFNTGGDCNPDMVELLHHEFYVESKAHGPAGRRFVLYDRQIKSYQYMLETYWPEDIRKFAFEPVLLYLFWEHKIEKVGSYPDRDSLRKAFAKSKCNCYLLDFWVIEHIVNVSPLTEHTVWAREASPYYQLRSTKLKLLSEGNVPAFIAQWKLNRALKEFEHRRFGHLEFEVYGLPFQCSLTYFLTQESSLVPSVSRFLEAIGVES